MTIDTLKNYKKILIVGFGKEGHATVEFLKKNLPDSHIDVADIVDDPHYLEKQVEYDLVIKTPGIPKKNITVPYTTATNIFFANCKGRVIGVTGTKGKSTTSSLIYHVLREKGLSVSLVGNIGSPALAQLSISNSKDDIFVYELSSYQLDDCKYSPHIAVFLNIFPDHMNYHSSFDEYLSAKSHITTNQKESDYLIFNSHDKHVVRVSTSTKAKKISIADDLPFKLESINLHGVHNETNIKTAYTVCQLFSISNEEFLGALHTFTPLPHRMQNVGTFCGITFINDAAGTTPESTIFALDTHKDTKTILLGGQDRGYDFAKLIDTIDNSTVENIILFPETGSKLKRLFASTAKKNYHFFETESMEQAVKWAYEYTPSNATCLLSCASPSYSLWKNFDEKGKEFMQNVVKYGTR